MASDPPLLDEDLQAYVDGELHGHRREAITHRLLNFAEGAAKVATWQEQNRAIRAAFSGVVSEPIPPSLTFNLPINACDKAFSRVVPQHCQAPTYISHGSKCVWRTGLICAAFVLGLLTAFGVMLTYRPNPFKFSPPSLIGVNAERDFLQRTITGLEGFTRSPERPEEKIYQEESPALLLPSLAPEGLTLAGIRIFPNRGSNMACLFYSKPKLSFLALCVEGTSEADSKIDIAGSFPKAAAFWRQKGAAYALSGPLPEMELRHLAQAVVPEIKSFDPPLRFSQTR